MSEEAHSSANLKMPDRNASITRTFSSMGDSSLQGMATSTQWHAPCKSVTHQPGLICYPSTRTVPLTTRWSRPGQPEPRFGAILVLAGRAAPLEALGQRRVEALMSRRNIPIPTVLRSPVTLSIASLAASFVAAYQLDDLPHRLRLYAGTTFHFQPFVLLSALTPVLVVSVVLVMARFVLTRVPPTPAVPA